MKPRVRDIQANIIVGIAVGYAIVGGVLLALGMRTASEAAFMYGTIAIATCGLMMMAWPFGDHA